jgi:hypothetical protein
MQSDFKKHVLSLTFDNHCNFSLSYLHASDFKKRGISFHTTTIML